MEERLKRDLSSRIIALSVGNKDSVAIAKKYARESERNSKLNDGERRVILAAFKAKAEDFRCAVIGDEERITETIPILRDAVEKLERRLNIRHRHVFGDAPNLLPISEDTPRRIVGTRQQQIRKVM